MKRCPTCSRLYDDDTLKFCLDDGTQLADARRYDAEAETLRNVPKQPEMSSQDIIMEIADHLRSTLGPGDHRLIRFETLSGLGLTTAQVSEHLEAAAEKADCEVLDKTDTRAIVQRNPARLVRS